MHIKIGWLLSVFSFSLYAANSSAITISKMFEYFLDRSRLVEDQKTKALFTIYKDACQFVITKNYTNVPDEICYKLEAAQITFVLGDDVVNEWIWPRLVGWKALKEQVQKLENYQQRPEDIASRAGLCTFFRKNGQRHVKERETVLNGRPYPNKQQSDTVYLPYGDPRLFYTITHGEFGYALMLSNALKTIKNLLAAPFTGVVFAFNFYYGKISLSSKEAFLYKDCSPDQNSSKSFYLSDLIPWDEKIDDIEFWATKEDGSTFVLCFTFVKGEQRIPFYYRIYWMFSS